jgi:hypothetical protein
MVDFFNQKKNFINFYVFSNKITKIHYFNYIRDSIPNKIFKIILFYFVNHHILNNLNYYNNMDLD